MAQFLFIDASYYLFYRYYALTQWWKHAKPDDELGLPIENKDFMNCFESVFIKKINEFVKKMKLNDPIIIVGKDCPRKDIWRMGLFEKYKGNRVYEDNWPGGPVFKYAFDEQLFKKAGAHMILNHPHLEADDCIALSIRNIRGICPNALIYILTSDMDYLQLADSKTFPVNLKYKYLTDSKCSFKDSKKDLFCKIVTGDKSDFIPGIFKKCGIKTASKYYENPELFKKKLGEGGAAEQYKLNTTLIDFNSIPEKYVKEFNSGDYTIKY